MTERSVSTKADLRRELNTACARLSTCGQGLRESTHTILDSFRAAGTRGSACQDLLRAKTEDLRRLSMLCDVASERLLNLGDQVPDDMGQEKAMCELVAVSRFVADQLRCEEAEARCVLSVLRDSRPADPGRAGGDCEEGSQETRADMPGRPPP